LRHNLQDLFHHRLEVFLGQVFVDEARQKLFDTPYTFYSFGYIKILSCGRLKFFAHLEAVVDRRDGLAVFTATALTAGFEALLGLGVAVKTFALVLRALTAGLAAALALVETRAVLLVLAEVLEADILISKHKIRSLTTRDQQSPYLWAFRCG
jgi:hypothetical protein